MRCRIEGCPETAKYKRMCPIHYRHDYYIANRHRQLATVRCYRQNNRQRIRDAAKKYRATHHEEIKTGRQAYYRSFKGRILAAYSSMQARVTGRAESSRRYPNVWLGKPILSKRAFVAWAQSDVAYRQLHEAWAAANYSQRLTPSIDRIGGSGGYTLGNMRWIPMYQQARNNKAIIMLSYNGQTLPMVEWAEKLGVPVSCLRYRYDQKWPIDQLLQPSSKKRVSYHV